MSRALVAGCGYLGSALSELLVQAGHDVLGLRRHPSEETRFETLTADLTVPSTLRLPDPIDVVFYTAAPDVSEEEGYRDIYVTGLRNLLDAVSSDTRILFTSSTAVYAQDDGSFVDEQSETKPRGFRGRVLLEAEALLAERRSASTLRLGGIYGPGRSRAVDAVRAGTAHFVPGRYMNWIHRDDAARALFHLMTLRRLEPVYIGVDEEPVESETFYEWLARRTASAKPERDEMRGRGLNKRCSSARLRASGFRFRFPTFREGFECLIH